jgi:DNA segregation ATPase FtsK/SpoIIIE, S-DNA-T family
MGKNIVGAPVTLDLAKMPHLLVAGATGAGKSVSINTMICSLLLRNTPEEVRLIMVDPKCLELSCYNDIPHLLLPVVTDPKKANIALRWAVNEMERRYQLLADMKVRDIVAYNRKVDKVRSGDDEQPGGGEDKPPEPLQEAAPSKILVVRKNADGTEEPIGLPVELPPAIAEPASAGGDDGEPVAADGEEPAPRRRRGPLPRRLPYIVVVIDEFADLMMASSKDVETSVARLAQKARAAGLHVILATQRPSVDVITGLIKANFPSRVSFQVASNHDSKTILGTQGAENLLGSGDMLVLDRGAEMKRLHGAYISDDEIRRIVDWLKEQGRPVYDMDILKPPPDDEVEAEAGSDELADEMYDQAVALVIETRQASISMIQRRLRVGYNRAARMVERMEREGVVSPPDHVKGREVLVPSLPQ